MASAIKAVQQLPLESSWAERRVYYGKDRCAHVNKQQQTVQQQNQAILGSMGIQTMQQQVLPHMGVAYSANTDSNFGNRTVYLGNIHPETTLEEICNVVRGGILHHIRYIPEKHICFVTFVDPNSAIAFFGLSNMQGLLIHNRRLKIGWGKHSGPLPTQIALAVGAGASRNVYVGNIEDNLTEDQLKADFSEYGEIELVNTLREKSCAFINFTNLSSAIKAIEGIKSKEGYKDRYRINFGKDRCGNASKSRTTGLPIMPTQYQPMLVMPLNGSVAPPSSYFPNEPTAFPTEALENLRLDKSAENTQGTSVVNQSELTNGRSDS